VQGDSELIEAVDALHPARRLAGSLRRGQESRDHYGDDRDHDQQFNQRETTTLHGIPPSKSQRPEEKISRHDAVAIVQNPYCRHFASR
jgi:hypothetical protein